MNQILTRRDYHLTRFRIERYLEKGFDKLSQDELEDLRSLSKELSRYEAANFTAPAPGSNVTANEQAGNA